MVSVIISAVNLMKIYKKYNISNRPWAAPALIVRTAKLLVVCLICLHCINSFDFSSVVTAQYLRLGGDFDTLDEKSP